MNRFLLRLVFRRMVGGCIYSLLILLFVVGFLYVIWPRFHTVPPLVIVTPSVPPTVISTPTPMQPMTPLIPYGAYKGPSYSHLAWATMYTYKGVAYALIPGRDGRLWGDTAQDKLVLLYGNRSAYR